jgi:hypothetical protein
VVKDTERDELVDVIRRVMAGERVVSIDGGGSSGAALSRRSRTRDHGFMSVRSVLACCRSAR